MNGIKGSLPLAFILAMASEASATGIPETNNTAAPLRAGVLADLLKGAVQLGPDGNDDRPMQSIPGEKTVQFFPNFPNFPNFFNCFNGRWRNC